jgi:hypothetical protein
VAIDCHAARAVRMRVLMLQRRVRVGMCVVLGQVQPDAQRHQVEKYAPARAVPKCRRPTTNSARLTP